MNIIISIDVCVVLLYNALITYTCMYVMLSIMVSFLLDDIHLLIDGG